MAKPRPPQIDPSPVRAHVAQIGAATSFAAAERALDAMARAIDRPLMAWAPDVGRPLFDARMHAFMRRHGWPESVLDLWWDRHVMLKMPVYIRCRVEHLPFAVPVAVAEGARAPAEVRRIEEGMLGLGLRSMVVAPVVLPRGRVAMLSWIGPQPLEDARRTCAALRAELLAAGHFFMEAFDQEVGRPVAGAEEAAPLTPQEWECLRLLAQGYRDAEIARLKGLAPTTIRFHLDNVVRKLGAANRTHAVARAAQLGVLGAIGG